MFSAHCNAEGREVLLTTRRITSIEMRDGETEIHFTCWCGHEGVLVDPAVARPAGQVGLASSASGAMPARPGAASHQAA
jgi:hypothetical protein